MNVPNLFHFLKGYVIIEVKGSFAERFINIALRRQILLWDIKRINEKTMTMKVGIRGFFMLTEVVKKSGCKVSIKKRSGLPFALNKYKKRKAFLYGAIGFMVFMVIMSSYIWEIDITGSDQIDQNLLRQQLAESGLKKGTLKWNIESDHVAQRVLTLNDDLIWLAVNIKGTKAFVEYKEKKHAPEIVPENEPCNIVAAKGGRITAMTTKNGEPVVEIDQVVKEGQLLVSGALNSRVEGMRIVRADASVIAITGYEEECDIPFQKQLKEPTGEQIVKNKLKIFEFGINLYFSSSIPYENYDKIEEESKLNLFGFELPITIIKNSYSELSLKTETIDRQTAVAEGEKMLNESIKGKLSEGAEVLDIRSIVTDKENGVHVRLIVECNEEIATRAAITIEE